MTTKAEKMAAELEAYFAAKELNTAPAWRPEPGQSLFGTVTGFRMGRDNGYGEYPIVIVQTENGPVSVHAFHTLMRDGFKSIRVRKGTRVAVTYDGVRVTNDTADKPEKEQTTYHSYFVADLDKITAQSADVEAEGLFLFD